MVAIKKPHPNVKDGAFYIVKTYYCNWGMIVSKAVMVASKSS